MKNILLAEPTHRTITKTRKVYGHDQSIIPLIAEGDTVRVDQPIASDGAEIIPAGIAGKVLSITEAKDIIIETNSLSVQGVFGIGRQIAGTVLMYDRVEDIPGGIVPGSILIVKEAIKLPVLYKARTAHAGGVVGTSMEFRDIEGFLQTDVLDMLGQQEGTAQSTDIALSIMLLDGFGRETTLPQQTVVALEACHGMVGLLSPETIPFHAIQPDIVISL